eukprot:m.108873 g.108873  ORF g.108873 m.108873 type:complete len:172 (-) comp15336_c0_seq63:175-690(-)
MNWQQYVHELVQPEPRCDGECCFVRDCDRIFHGLLESTVICGACQHASVTCQTYGYIALELETDNVPFVLGPLLEHFLLPEDLGGNVYHCSGCSLPQAGSRRSRRPSTSANRMEAVLRPATKQLALKTLPQVLKFQLKRFHWQGRDRAKISKHVGFEFELVMNQTLPLDHG